MKKIFIALTSLIILTGVSFAEFPAVEVYKKTSKSVVLIISRGDESASMVGAGSIVLSPGIIATNAHVVIDKAKAKPFPDIFVYLKPDKVTGNFRKDLVDRHKAKIIAYDTDLDLAVLKIESPPKDAGTIELADPEEIKIGEEAVAIGHPEQGGLWTLTYGRISGEIANQNNVDGKDVFQTDASVNRGNSGGPLIDKRGYMIAINTNIARLGAGDLPITGVNFAIKASVLKKWLDRQGIMLAYGTRPLTEDKSGAAAVSSTIQQETPLSPPLRIPSDKKIEEQKTVPSEMQKAEPAKEEKTGPVEEEKKALPEKEQKAVTEEKKDEGEKASPDKEPTKKAEEKVLPPKRPYDYDALLKSVEEDLQDMMEDMKSRIRR
ncbi:MAG: trypsin-like peptidase domain-containing protein [Nitrospirae bacterium]|nr:trypsin-like peptidase domain-containing protein [Nitrospirota bacterium]